jgi:hypothetical protein
LIERDVFTQWGGTEQNPASRNYVTAVQLERHGSNLGRCRVLTWRSK